MKAVLVLSQNGDKYGVTEAWFIEDDKLRGMMKDEEGEIVFGTSFEGYKSLDEIYFSRNRTYTSAAKVIIKNKDELKKMIGIENVPNDILDKE